MLKTVIFSFREHDYQQYTKCDLSQGVLPDRPSLCPDFPLYYRKKCDRGSVIANGPKIGTKAECLTYRPLPCRNWN